MSQPTQMLDAPGVVSSTSEALPEAAPSPKEAAPETEAATEVKEGPRADPETNTEPDSEATEVASTAEEAAAEPVVVALPSSDSSESSQSPTCNEGNTQVLQSNLEVFSSKTFNIRIQVRTFSQHSSFMLQSLQL